MTYRRLTPTDFCIVAPQLIGVHLAAMAYPASLAGRKLASWKADSRQPGFRAIAALTPDRIIGIAYGFLGSQDTWWDQQLRRAIADAGTDPAVAEHYFEVAEIHVAPGYQGHGVGRTLLIELLRGVAAPRALLSTPEVPGEANAAFALYRRAGFTDVARDFHYPGDERGFAILACRLPLDGPAD
ncbi:acetyltransferase (GNAT) family protein [Corynebacterium uterequi]|uniref:Acetyltransferase (GNAT) family protein n=1 Tax=Corynebacterium uterequi TaxID=1072256 RepID=A0A0G3HFE5_9CORY|nr:acetyltransferase (GNAT) family protein [Corynebacterium uterequi]